MPLNCSEKLAHVSKCCSGVYSTHVAEMQESELIILLLRCNSLVMRGNGCLARKRGSNGNTQRQTFIFFADAESIYTMKISHDGNALVLVVILDFVAF